MSESGGPIEARYSNHLEIGHNAFEFLLVFGQLYDSKEEPARVQARIVTSPYYAKHFSVLLQEAIRLYEEDRGPIPEEEPR